MDMGTSLVELIVVKMLAISVDFSLADKLGDVPSAPDWSKILSSGGRSVAVKFLAESVFESLFLGSL